MSSPGLGCRGSRVWITRTEPGATRLAEALERRGYGVLVKPVLAVEPVVSALPDGAPTLVIVLSEHGARCYLRSALRERCGQAPHIAIGARTARVLRNAGVAADTPAHADSEGVLEMPAVRALEPADRVWLVAGEGGRDLLERTLRARCSVCKIVVYRRVPLAGGEVSAASVDTIVVSSGEALQAVRSLWRGTLDVLLIVPSARVAQAAAARGFSNVVSAGGADPDSVLEALETHGRQT